MQSEPSPKPQLAVHKKQAVDSFLATTWARAASLTAWSGSVTAGAALRGTSVGTAADAVSMKVAVAMMVETLRLVVSRRWGGRESGEWEVCWESEVLTTHVDGEMDWKAVKDV